jgi:hypothetical protein
MLTDPEISVKVSAYKEVPRALNVVIMECHRQLGLCSRLSIPLCPVAYCSYVNPIKIFPKPIKVFQIH